ncbi:MafI family immunity protein [Glycomyces sp. NPDC047369]
MMLALLGDCPITRDHVAEDARDLVRAGEVELAFDTMCSWLFEDDLPISQDYYERLVAAARELAMSRAVERLDELIPDAPQGNRPGQARMHQYRVLKAAWGIVISVTAQYGPRGGAEPGMALTETTPELHLARTVQDRLGTDGMHELARGMRTGLALARLTDPPESIRVLDVQIVETDFQVEGLAAAGYEWISREFWRSLPPVRADFDAAANRYLIELP